MILRLASVLSLAWTFYVLKWVWALKNCVCAEKWQLDYITATYLAFILYDLNVLVTGVHDPVYFYIFLAGTFILALVSLWYVKRLKDTRCVCTESKQRTLIYWLSIKQLVAVPLISAFVLTRKRPGLFG
jgi:hypothetical protein